MAAVAAAGYPYFFAVILGYRERVGLGRVSYVCAALVVIGGYGVVERLPRNYDEQMDGPGLSAVQLGS